MSTQVGEPGFELVDPELRAGLQELLRQTPHTLDAVSLPQMRDFMRSFARPVLPTPIPVERLIPGIEGAPDVRVYIIGGASGACKPAVLHLHGGGFVSSGAAVELRNAQELALALDCVVVTVESAGGGHAAALGHCRSRPRQSARRHAGAHLSHAR